MFLMGILDISWDNAEEGMDFVNILANWKCERIGRSFMAPSLILSRIKWQSISIFLVRSWKTGLVARWIAESLSQNITASVGTVTCKSLRSWIMHKTSLVVVANARYSASVEERDMVICFLVFQEIRASPWKTQKPVTDFLWIHTRCRVSIRKGTEMKRKSSIKEHTLARHSLEIT